MGSISQAFHARAGRRFAAAMDWWVATVVIAVLIVLAAAIPLTVWQAGSVALAVTGSLLLIALFLLVVDRAFFTSYYLADEGLVITGQLRRVAVPYRAMRTITRGSVLSLVSTASQKRFSLSSDCLVISLAGYEWKKITVSPRDKDRFLEQLLQRIDKERSGRATPKRKARRRHEG